jgi:hypothetical protein
VSVGWSPYTQGRWSYTPFGWTWVSYEPWGWAPYHYGRWGYGSLGWYWVPGSYWGPAWVSWAFGPSWVGWCPLGYTNRPIYSYRSVFDYRGGHYGGGYRGHGWSFVDKGHFRSVPVERTRLRVEDVRATADQGSLFESGAILDRDLRPVAVGTTAMSRATELLNRAASANAPDSASSARAGLRRGARGTPSTMERTGASGFSAVPRFVGGSSGSSTSGSRAPVPLAERTRDVTGRTPEGTSTTAGAPTGISNRGGSPSTLGLVRSGVQRGELATGGNEDAATIGRSFIIRTPGSSPDPAGVIESSRGMATTRTPTVPSERTEPSGNVTPGPVERSMGRSAGSKDFFGRGPSSVVGPRSQDAGVRATPRTPQAGSSSNRSSSAASSSGSSNRASGGGSGSSNRNDNRGSSRPRN